VTVVTPARPKPLENIMARTPADSIRTMADIPRFHGQEDPEREALVAGGRTWTFGQLDAESSQVAQGLASLGVGAGDRVAFLDKNSPEYFTQLFGGAKVNAVSVAVNWRLAPPEMEYILNDAEAKVLFVGDEFLEHLSKINLETVSKVVVVGDPGFTGHESYADWVNQFPAEDPGVEAAGTDTCYQLYTSGTTGLPKGVELTNDNFFSLLGEAIQEWRFTADSVNLVAMPLFHIAGSGWGVVGLYIGAKTILLREINPPEILEVIPQHQITHALLVPAVLQFLLVTPGVESTDFSTLDIMVYGASPITEQVLVASMQTFGCDFIQAYGLTETTGGITILRPEDHDPGGPRAHLLRSAGAPWTGVELRIVNPENREDLPEGQVGEIWCRTSQIMKGYWKNPEATAAAIVDGWFRTGDAGYLRDGYLFIHDRVKDMIVSGGENIYPAEIENALMKHPGVADVAVIGVPDEKWGESVKAIITRSDPDLTEQDVIAFARDHLAGYKIPRSIDWMDALPRNPSGKILKTELRKPYWEGKDRMVG
jgi:long-chain acyl-CoA synthetase